MATTKAQQKAVNTYVRNHYDRISITTPQGVKDLVKRHASSMGESMQGFILRAIVETIERDRSPNGIFDGGITPALQAFYDSYHTDD